MNNEHKESWFGTAQTARKRTERLERLLQYGNEPHPHGYHVKVMDLDIDLLQEEDLFYYMKEYLSNDYINIVYLVSMNLLEMSAQDPEMKAKLEAADLLLPGEKAVLTLHHADQLEQAGMIVDTWVMRDTLCGLLRNKKTVYYLGESEEDIKTMVLATRLMNPYLDIVGNYIVNETANDELVINDINIHAPDIILFSMSSPKQENWLEENKVKLNAKLCIAIGDVMDLVTRRQKQAPRLIRFLHLQRIYHGVIHNWGRIHSRRMRIFKKKMENYNSK